MAAPPGNIVQGKAQFGRMETDTLLAGTPRSGVPDHGHGYVGPPRVAP